MSVYTAMRCWLTKASLAISSHLLLRICDDDDDCDWGYRVYGVQGAHETVICEGDDRVVTAALTSDRIAIWLVGCLSDVHQLTNEQHRLRAK